MPDSRIIPMLRNYMGDEMSARPSEAEWFRVEVSGKWVGDFGTQLEANHAFALAHRAGN